MTALSANAPRVAFGAGFVWAFFGSALASTTGAGGAFLDFASGWASGFAALARRDFGCGLGSTFNTLGVGIVWEVAILFALSFFRLVDGQDGVIYAAFRILRTGVRDRR